MARFYPELTESQLKIIQSQAEATVYQHLKSNLDDTYVIIYGKSFIAPRRDGGHKDGEADFIVFSEAHGFLVIEVKGGGVSFHPSNGWQSLDRWGNANLIKDPVAQAKSQKHAILSMLQSNPLWNRVSRRIPIGHAVLFPDTESTAQLHLPDCPPAIVGGKKDLDNILGWIKQVFAFWRGNDDYSLGKNGIHIVEKILCRPIEVRPLLRELLDSDEKVRVKLTNEQASVLRTLSRQKKAAIVGAAGTGKTLLAIEKARMLALTGAKVLLLCYNRALGVTLAKQFPVESSVTVLTFHQFCKHCITLCNNLGLPDPYLRAYKEMPGEDKFEVHYPLAAYYAIEAVGDALQFDAIIIDEGQDFGEEYWLPIELALRSQSDSFLFIFYDENQRVYTRVSSFPIPEQDTFPLTRNCRNSKPVHNLAYRFYKGETVDDSGIEGIPPILMHSPSVPTQAKQIASKITQLISTEGISAESIAVLITGSPKEDYYQTLMTQILPKTVCWSREEHYLPGSVLVDTVKRFKGLEREIVFLWVNQNVITDDSLMYVGISRAKSILFIVGDKSSITTIEHLI